MADVLATLGRRLTALRTARGWTRKMLATRVGLGTSYISLLEQGERLPSIETTVLLAEVMGAPAQALLTEPLPDFWLSNLRILAQHDEEVPRG